MNKNAVLAEIWPSLMLYIKKLFATILEIFGISTEE